TSRALMARTGWRKCPGGEGAEACPRKLEPHDAGGKVPRGGALRATAAPRGLRNPGGPVGRFPLHGMPLALVLGARSVRDCKLLRANPPKDGDAEPRGYREFSRHARRAASEIDASIVAAFSMSGRHVPV